MEQPSRAPSHTSTSISSASSRSVCDSQAPTVCTPCEVTLPPKSGAAKLQEVDGQGQGGGSGHVAPNFTKPGFGCGIEAGNTPLVTRAETLLPWKSAPTL